MYSAVVPALAGTCGKGAAAKVLGRAKTACFDLEAESTHGLVAMTSAYHAEGRQLDPGWVYSAVVPALAGTCGIGSGLIPR